MNGGILLSAITKDRAREILSNLVAIPSVNPMGRPYARAERVERGVADYIESLFASYNAKLERQPYSTLHENLLIFVPGQTDGPCTLLESHMDTVPADDWPDMAFTPRLEEDILYGRGACDDKGPLTSMILAVMDLLETGARPYFPTLLLCAGDEEHAQTGIRTFRDSPYRLGRGIFGEPTSCLPVVQHRGTIRWDITVHGKSAHTSKPYLGVNAILGMMDVIAALQEHQRDVQARYTSDLLPGPALTVTMIHGGRTRNAVPDECTISVDYRIVPGMKLEESLEEVKRRLEKLGHKITHHPFQIMTRPLDTSPGDPFSQQVLEVCRRYIGPEAQLQGVPYGTDAAWVSDLIPALVLGPGSIDSAHAVDEHIDLNEVVTCAQIYRDILFLVPTDPC